LATEAAATDQNTEADAALELARRLLADAGDRAGAIALRSRSRPRPRRDAPIA
jgi:hypothetical protein